MYDRVIIAEKPSVARDIATFLGNVTQQKGYLEAESGKTAVTNAAGHLYEQLMPEDYTGGEPVAIPWIPPDWKIRPKDARAAQQIRLIHRLIGDAKVIINCGDSDREGQLLVDEILEDAGVDPDGPKVKRLWLSATDPDSIAKAFAKLAPNADYRGFRYSARSRSRSDLLLGINGSRALMRSFGVFKSVSMGRVQSPVAELVNERCQAIRNFKPVKYYVPFVKMPDGTTLQWKESPTAGEGIDEEGRIVSRQLAEEIAARARKASWECTRAESEPRNEPPPLPHSLDSLQSQLGRAGIGAKAVLEACQSLYENKISTYPRTDCRYLPKSMLDDRPKILKGITHLFQRELAGADLQITGRAYNDGKITAHHAIVPTGVPPRGMLSPVEQRVYQEITRNWIAQMYPDAKYQDFMLDVQFSGTDLFSAKTSVLTAPGWRAMHGVTAEDSDADANSAKRKSEKTLGRNR
ncbi:hypothetical protein E2P84_43855 [Burkholderia cepacia]|uniref:DNA topoisomerase n=1 Tax=Burkholderia cepacia TaxID=292 RepID=A0AAX2RN07_BURCE|nr:DNA topoisomerase [Burkholderia cepacia]TES61110.1 hypothetical protein E2P84_43855 [Burkholderia cepacia]TET01631.1 hypothetical protein E3D36_16480 [Burkholderia cepacia]TEU47489.1 hypothetical protein E3D37_15910 [Burkholderia cepacia]TEU53516.1 hypothetical protein E3D38_12300 [Burkholderia cepacia]TEV02122.1 hypothetical protein E3D40_13230 [Burkholderia cepacia]